MQNIFKNNDMTRKELIIALKEHFDIRELVCPDVFKAFGERAWQFFDLQFLQMLLITRTEINTEGMICNNWANGGPFSQRGLRCNICHECKDKTLKGQLYMTAHANGAALDYDVPGLTAEQVRKRIIANADKFPFKIRLEGKVNWVHQDIYDDINSNNQVTIF